jgi:2-deoxy-D-gluconate 3-dehydrogenase
VRKAPQDFTLDEWNAVMDVNLTSLFLCARAAHPLMVRAGAGKSHQHRLDPVHLRRAYATAYCASKGGIVQFTKSLAIAWAGDRIQVNAVLPGWIDTDLTVGARAQVAGLNERVLARTPAGRWGQPCGPGGDRGVPGEPGERFRDRGGDPGRRRIFGFVGWR